MRDPQDKAAGPAPGPATDNAATTRLVAPSVATGPDITPYVSRRPCATRGCRGTRPVTEVGSSRWWDRCARCTRRGLLATPYPVPDDRPDVEAWSERALEVLEQAESSR